MGNTVSVYNFALSTTSPQTYSFNVSNFDNSTSSLNTGCYRQHTLLTAHSSHLPSQLRVRREWSLRAMSNHIVGPASQRTDSRRVFLCRYRPDESLHQIDPDIFQRQQEVRNAAAIIVIVVLTEVASQRVRHSEEGGHKLPRKGLFLIKLYASRRGTST